MNDDDEYTRIQKIAALTTELQQNFVVFNTGDSSIPPG